MVETFIRVTRRLDSISSQLEAQTPALLSGSRSAVDESRTLIRELTGATREMRVMIQDSGKKLETAFAGWNSTMASGQAALDEVKQAADSAHAVVRRDSPIVSEMSGALRELAAAARSIRIMSEYLERHPEALLRGKQ
jgi:paraquat-inducible protein B